MLEAAPPNCSVVAKSPCTFGHFLVIGERPNSQEVSPVSLYLRPPLICISFVVSVFLFCSKGPHCVSGS